MNAASVLRRMIAAFEDPSNFATGRSARDAFGEGVSDPCDPKARSWCTVGLLARFTKGDAATHTATWIALRKGAQDLGEYPFLSSLNDRRGREFMLTVFRRALRTIEPVRQSRPSFPSLTAPVTL